MLTLTPTKKTSIYLNYDYLSEGRPMGGSYRVTGIGGAAKFQVNNWFALTPRLEWLNDADGFSTGTVRRRWIPGSSRSRYCSSVARATA